MQQEIFKPGEQIPCLNEEQRGLVLQAISEVFSDYDREHVVDGHAVTYCIDDIPADKHLELIDRVSKAVDHTFTVSIHEHESHVWLYITDMRPVDDIGY